MKHTACGVLVATSLAFAGAILAPLAAFAQAVPMPDRIKGTKTLNISVSNDFPPMGYRDVQTKELAGLSTIIVRAIGVNLGINFNLIDVAFPQVFPGLDSGRFDFVASSIVDFPVRRTKYTHLDYLKTGPQMFTTAANASKIRTAADLCGKSMGYPRFITVYPVILKELSDKECVANGKPPIELVSTDLPVQIALQQGRYDATMQTIEVVRHLQRQQPDAYVAIGQPLRHWLYGFGFLKGSEDIRDYVAIGLQRIIADGTYARELAKYGAADQAVTTVEIDAGQP